jgi:hypothetical protein
MQEYESSFSAEGLSEEDVLDWYENQCRPTAAFAVVWAVVVAILIAIVVLT